ncbi:MAG: ABC transporter permease [Verrucomicrobiota bacterium]|jgi:molybdate transport system permease protein|nr:ABC transporter permease [Verrucomicrobiota bacterium]
MSGPSQNSHRVASDKPFLIGLVVLGGSYLLIIAAMVFADLVYLNYGDRPVLGPERVKQGRYTGGEVTVKVEPGRNYFFRGGENESGLRAGDKTLTHDGLFRAEGGTVILLPQASGDDVPVTASLRPEARVSGIALTNGVATVTTDEAHGQLWGEFIRVSGADALGWDGVHEITHTTTNRLSFVIEAGTTAGTLELSRPNPLVQALRSRDIRFSIKLSLVSCTLTTLLSLWVAVPIGYLMSRFDFRGKPIIDTLLDIPIVLPPLVVGLSLLILFRYMPEWLSDAVVYKWPAVVLAQFMVACAFAVRTMRVTFDQIPQRFEQVALTLGCNRRQAFWRVIMPQAKGGLLAAGTLAWARALGEFGPILVFAGATRQKTEVLPTSAFLELQAGRTEGMLAVSLIMIAAAVVVFLIARTLGMKRIFA